jgi:hypothetical protein
MQDIEQRLLSRFKWGLSAELHQPDYETRISILRNKIDLTDPDFITINPGEKLCSTESTSHLTDEVGIKELDLLYYDIFDPSSKTWKSRSKEMEEKYQEDLKKFYTIFTGKSELPKNIASFKDIELFDFRSIEYCRDNLFTQDFVIPKENELIMRYREQVELLEKSTTQYREELLDYIKKIFLTKVENNVTGYTIQPTLTLDDILKIEQDTRNTIINLYTNCEQYFIRALLIFEELYDNQSRQVNESRIDYIENRRANVPLYNQTMIHTDNIMNQPVIQSSISNKMPNGVQSTNTGAPFTIPTNVYTVPPVNQSVSTNANDTKSSLGMNTTISQNIQETPPVESTSEFKPMNTPPSNAPMNVTPNAQPMIMTPNVTPANMTPPESQPMNLTSSESQPMNVTPTNVTPTNVTPTNMTPPESQPMNVTPTNVTPTNVTPPANMTPPESQPMNVTPTNVTQPESQPMNITPPESQPMNITPPESQPMNITPPESQPMNITPPESQPMNVTPTNVTPTNVTPTNVTPPANVTPPESQPMNLTSSESQPMNVTPTDAVPTNTTDLKEEKKETKNTSMFEQIKNIWIKPEDKKLA